MPAVTVASSSEHPASTISFREAAFGHDDGMGAVDPRTTAERYVEVDGRRWRATDPAIPEALRSELVHELMDARRAVAAGKRAEDEDAVARARERVGEAKVALGERGAPWWETPTEDAMAERLTSAILVLLRHRAPESTICPSDAARVTGGPGWRDHMDAARGAAFALQADGIVEVRSAGARVDRLEDAHGPLRVARGERWVWI